MTLLDRANTTATWAFLFVIGWASCTGYYKLGHLWKQQNTLVTVQHHEIPALKQQVAVLRHCVSIAVPVAKQAIRAASSDTVATPSPAALLPCPSP